MTIEEIVAAPWFGPAAGLAIGLGIGLAIGIVGTRLAARRKSPPPGAPDPTGFWTLKRLILRVVAIWAAASFATFLVVTLCEKFLGRGDPVPTGLVALGKTGTFGDTFGAVNSLFSALGVAGVAFALVLQYREQRDARLESTDAKELQTDLAVMAALIHGHSARLETLHKDLLREEDFIERSVVMPGTA
jgi:hypothetical protein